MQEVAGSNPAPPTILKTSPGAARGVFAFVAQHHYSRFRTSLAVLRNILAIKSAQSAPTAYGR